MFENIKLIGENLVSHVGKLAEQEQVIEIREFSSRFVADCLASIAFGQNVSSIENPNHEFRMNVQRLSDNSKVMNILRGTALFVCPG